MESKVRGRQENKNGESKQNETKIEKDVEEIRDKIIDIEDRQRISYICIEKSQKSGIGHMIENIIIENIIEM